jgi:hypothetical protein
MEPITDADALREVQWTLAKLVATTLFWSACLLVITGGGVYVVAVRGFEYTVPLVILIFTFGSGAWFWIRETGLAWQKSKAAAGMPARS